jgi:membrane-associated phospholipid phosphatase
MNGSVLLNWEAMSLSNHEKGMLAMLLLLFSILAFFAHVVFFVQYFGFLLFLRSARADQISLRLLIWLLVGSPIVLVGFSRVYVGAHWPSDALGGYLLGAILLFLMVKRYHSRLRNER